MSTPVELRTAPPRAWVGLAVLALPALLLSIDVSVLYLALPTLTRDLGAGSVAQLWIVDIYSFMLAGFLVTMGSLADRVGRRKIMLIGAAAFGLASLGAAFAPTPELLIAARAVMGIAGATLMPTILATIKTMFDGTSAMGSAIGVFFACFMLGMFIGPVLGGVLIDAFGWGAVFLLNVPIMVALLIIGPWLLPESRNSVHGVIDLVSVLLSLGALLPLAWGVKELARAGITVPALAAVVGGVAVGVLFVRRQRRLADPLVDLRLFRIPAFSGALVITGVGGIVMAGTSLASAVYLQSVAGLSPLAAGLWLIPQNVAMLAGFMIFPLVTKRIDGGIVMAAGLLLGAVGFALLTQVSADGFVLLVIAMSLAAFGVSSPMALGTNALMAVTPEAQAGSAASITETSGELGVALGVATLGSLAAVVYRFGLASSVPDAPAEASTGLEHALELARGLPSGEGAALVGAARDAFTGSVHVVGAVAAVVFVALAILAFLTLRRVTAAADGAAVQTAVTAPDGATSSERT